MRRLFKGIAVLVLIGATGFVVIVRPSVATQRERDVLAAANKTALPKQYPTWCTATWTRPQQGRGTYGFSNGESETTKVWLDRGSAAARGRNVSLLAGDRGGAALPALGTALSDLMGCSHTIQFGTPRFVGNLAFVTTAEPSGVGEIAFRREGSVWREVGYTFQLHGPVI